MVSNNHNYTTFLDKERILLFSFHHQDKSTAMYYNESIGKNAIWMCKQSLASV